MLPNPRRCALGKLPTDARPWAGPGGGDHASWSLRWWVVPCRPTLEGPIRFSGEQTAAAARPRYVRSAVR
jgi:hypothetical protein